MNAFKSAARAGFKLNAVSNAPLAQRRKNKKGSSTSSCDSRYSYLMGGTKPIMVGCSNYPQFNSGGSQSLYLCAFYCT